MQKRIETTTTLWKTTPLLPIELYKFREQRERERITFALCSAATIKKFCFTFSLPLSLSHPTDDVHVWSVIYNGVSSSSSTRLYCYLFQRELWIMFFPDVFEKVKNCLLKVWKFEKKERDSLSEYQFSIKNKLQSYSVGTCAYHVYALHASHTECVR